MPECLRIEPEKGEQQKLTTLQKCMSRQSPVRGSSVSEGVYGGRSGQMGGVSVMTSNKEDPV